MDLGTFKIPAEGRAEAHREVQELFVARHFWKSLLCTIVSPRTRRGSTSVRHSSAMQNRHTMERILTPPAMMPATAAAHLAVSVHANECVRLLGAGASLWRETRYAGAVLGKRRRRRNVYPIP